MTKVLVTKNLEKEIIKRLSKKEADNIFLLIASLEENPYKGDILTVIGNIILKEIKHKSFRFYCIHSTKISKVLTQEELKNELIKFVAMSKKGSEQQKTINKIKQDLKNFGFEWF